MTRRAFSFQKRLRIYWRDQFTCRYCGRAMHPLSEDLTLDHIEPNGGDADDNLATSCRSCNSSKGARPAHEAMTRKAVLGTLRDIPEALTSGDVQALMRVGAGRWGLTVEQVRSQSRERMHVRARAEIAHMLRDKGTPLATIAQLLARKDHSSIVHLLKAYPRSTRREQLSPNDGEKP